MPKERNKKTYNQKYTKVWETDPDLKGKNFHCFFFVIFQWPNRDRH